MEDVLTIKGISKIYDQKKIVDNLSFQLQKGHILAFLGPNGAGKSTTINMISSLIEPDDGTIYYNGKDVKKCLKEFKKEIGVVPQNLAIYEDLTAYKNLHFFASLYGIPKNRLDSVCLNALDFVGLRSFKDKKAGTFSGGMKRRLNIACSLVNDPKVIILDEPTVGIDPQSRSFILEAIKKLRQQGVSVIYTTHYMEEIEAIAEDVIIIDHGKILINDTLENIRSTFANQSLLSIETERISENLSEKILSITGVTIKSIKDCMIETYIDYISNISVVNDIMKILIEENCNVKHITIKEKNLEDIFLELTGTKLRD